MILLIIDKYVIKPLVKNVGSVSPETHKSNLVFVTIS